jgi:hypothetical protein
MFPPAAFQTALPLQHTDLITEYLSPKSVTAALRLTFTNFSRNCHVIHTLGSVTDYTTIRSSVQTAYAYLD